MHKNSTKRSLLNEVGLSIGKSVSRTTFWISDNSICAGPVFLHISVDLEYIGHIVRSRRWKVSRKSSLISDFLYRMKNLVTSDPIYPMFTAYPYTQRTEYENELKSQWKCHTDWWLKKYFTPSIFWFWVSVWRWFDLTINDEYHWRFRMEINWYWFVQWPRYGMGQHRASSSQLQD